MSDSGCSSENNVIGVGLWGAAPLRFWGIAGYGSLHRGD